MGEHEEVESEEGAESPHESMELTQTELGSANREKQGSRSGKPKEVKWGATIVLVLVVGVVLGIVLADTWRESNQPKPP